MKKVIVRKADNKDLPEIIKIIDRHYRKYGDFVNLGKYDSDLNNLDENYFSKNGNFWVAEIDNTIVGSIAAVPVSGEILEIKRVYVVDRYHGTNVSHNLMKNALKFAIQNNFDKVILWSDKRYKRAHSFFKKYNFEAKSVKKFYDADNPYTSILFELDTNKIPDEIK